MASRKSCAHQLHHCLTSAAAWKSHCTALRRRYPTPVLAANRKRWECFSPILTRNCDMFGCFFVDMFMAIVVASAHTRAASRWEHAFQPFTLYIFIGLHARVLWLGGSCSPWSQLKVPTSTLWPHISTEVRSKHRGRGGGMSGACDEIMKKHRNLCSFLSIFCFWSLMICVGVYWFLSSDVFFHVLDQFFMFLIKPLQARKKSLYRQYDWTRFIGYSHFVVFSTRLYDWVEAAATSLCLQLICPVLSCITAIHIL